MEGYIKVISSIIAPHITITIILSISVLRYPPIIYTILTYILSYASKFQVSSTDYNAVVGYAASSFMDPPLFFLSYAHVLPLIRPYLV